MCLLFTFAMNFFFKLMFSGIFFANTRIQIKIKGQKSSKIEKKIVECVLYLQVQLSEYLGLCASQGCQKSLVFPNGLESKNQVDYPFRHEDQAPRPQFGRIFRGGKIVHTHHELLGGLKVYVQQVVEKCSSAMLVTLMIHTLEKSLKKLTCVALSTTQCSKNGKKYKCVYESVARFPQRIT